MCDRGDPDASFRSPCRRGGAGRTGSRIRASLSIVSDSESNVLISRSLHSAVNTKFVVKHNLIGQIDCFCVIGGLVVSRSAPKSIMFSEIYFGCVNYFVLYFFENAKKETKKLTKRKKSQELEKSKH